MVSDPPANKSPIYIYIEPLHIVEQIVRSVVSEGIQDWLNVVADDDLLLHGQVRTEFTAPGYRDTKTHTETHCCCCSVRCGTINMYIYIHIVVNCQRLGANTHTHLSKPFRGPSVAHVITIYIYISYMYSCSHRVPLAAPEGWPCTSGYTAENTASIRRNLLRAGCRFTDNLSGRPTFTELEGGTNEDVAYWYEVASIKKFKFRTSTEIYIHIYYTDEATLRLIGAWGCEGRPSTLGRPRPSTPGAVSVKPGISPQNKKQIPAASLNKATTVPHFMHTHLLQIISRFAAPHTPQAPIYVLEAAGLGKHPPQ